MRIVLLSMLAGLLVPAARGEEQVNEEVVKAVRAAISAKRESERKDLVDQLLARKDLDWASFTKGLREGPYYQKPLVTAYGDRGSGKDLNLRLTGADGKERGFSFFVPKKYDAETPLPAILYLHHDTGLPHPNMGAERAGVAMFKFRDICEERGIFFIAPYTCEGAEWWTREGERLVRWTLAQMRERYNLDEDRMALMGALDGGDAVWYLGQQLPGTWSVLMPMTGDPYEISGIVRPLFLGTLDRMDVLMGVPGLTRSTVGEKNQNQFLDGLSPMFKQGMRITTTIWPRAQGDFHYLPDIKAQVAAFVTDRSRKPLAAEVDIETERPDGLRSLWLRNEGYDRQGETPHSFPTTILKWTPPKRKDADKKIGVGLQARDGWEVGLVINNVSGATRDANIFNGDILLEVDGVAVKKVNEVGPLIQKHDWEDEVHLLLCREVKESDLERARKREERYKKVRAEIERLRAEGKEVPRDIWAHVEDDPEPEDEAEEEDDDGEISIEIGDEEKGDGDKKKEKGPGKAEKEKTVFFVFERWVEIRKPVGELVRRDFGISQDHTHRYEGVRIGRVYPGSLADRSGLRMGDVIVQVGSDEVKNGHDLANYFAEFKFEDEPEGERFVDLTVKRQNEQGEWGPARTVTVRWEPVEGARVDAKWNKQEKQLDILARKCSGFTLYFTGEFVDPGEEFHLFINGVPYKDLVDPDSAPEYPREGHGMDGLARDELYRSRRQRAKVEGWSPDYRLAIEDYFENRDRKLILGASRTINLTELKKGFEKARERMAGRRDERGDKVKQAYDEYRAQG